MKSVLAILAIVVASLILIFFYLGQALEAPESGTENLPSLTGFRGPTAGSGSGSPTSSAKTFSPPVFIGPFASPQIIGPRSNPPAPMATTTGP